MAYVVKYSNHAIFILAEDIKIAPYIAVGEYCAPVVVSTAFSVYKELAYLGKHWFLSYLSIFPLKFCCLSL
ncbi:hypothetical protein [Chlamydia psittaci]|uniref:hypothetical protein n=1 Tax=Chlamydia psittaci TaxID=83554 RepID=UPI0003030807|nr:hypothetical protein [Chlamydia psittaci]